MKKLLLTAVLALGTLGICLTESSAQDGWYTYRNGMWTWTPPSNYYVYPASYTYSSPTVVTSGYSTTPWVTTSSYSYPATSYYYPATTYANYPTYPSGYSYTYPTTYYYPSYSYYRPARYAYSYPAYYYYRY